MARKLRIDMTGQRHGRLLAIRFAHRNASGHAHWLFRCDCGREVVAHGGNVRSGNSTSCGCLHRERSAARLFVHGHRAARRHDPTYRAWQQMNDGCANPASPHWPLCGGRGVVVTERWRADYRAFLADLGERPTGTVLRRLDADGNFSLSNCHWGPTTGRAHAGAGSRAASSQSRSGPAAASTMRASIAR